MAILWEPVPLVKLGSEACCLTLTHPLGQELIAVCVLSISADHAPSLLAQPPHNAKNADSGPLICLLIRVIAIWLNSIILVEWANFTKVTARKACLRDTEQVLCNQEGCDQGSCATPPSTTVHQDSLILLSALSTLFNHFLGHVCHPEII